MESHTCHRGGTADIPHTAIDVVQDATCPKQWSQLDDCQINTDGYYAEDCGNGNERKTTNR